MENNILERFRTMVGSDRNGVAGLEKWGQDDLEDSLAKLEKGHAALMESLERISAAEERMRAEGGENGKIEDLEAYAERLQENRDSLESQIELLHRAEKDPDAIADSVEERKHLRSVLDGTPMQMHRVGHAIYLVDEWFYERQPGERVDRRKEVEQVIENIKSGSMRSRN